MNEKELLQKMQRLPETAKHNALVALALLVAQSDSADKEIMIKLIINLING